MWNLIKSIMHESVMYYRTHTRHVLAYATWMFLPGLLAVVADDAFKQFINAHLEAGNISQARNIQFLLIGLQLALFLVQIWIATAFARTISNWKINLPTKTVLQELLASVHLLPRAIGAWIIMSFAVILGVIVPLFYFTPVGLIIGLVLAIVGTYLGVRFAFTFSIIALEETSLSGALAKSAAMVHGRWWYTLMVIFVPVIIFSLITSLIVNILEFPVSFITLESIQISGLLFGVTLLFSVITSLVNAAMAPLVIAAPTIAYLRMKR